MKNHWGQRKVRGHHNSQYSSKSTISSRQQRRMMQAQDALFRFRTVMNLKWDQQQHSTYAYSAGWGKYLRFRFFRYLFIWCKTLRVFFFSSLFSQYQRTHKTNVWERKFFLHNSEFLFLVFVAVIIVVALNRTVYHLCEARENNNWWRATANSK